MTAPLRHPLVADGRGHRRPETLAALARRDELIRLTVAVYFPGSSANDAAHRLHTALHRYECGAWRRDRVSDVCPSRHTGRINGHCWQILPRDRAHAEATINPGDPQQYSLPKHRALVAGL